MSNLPTIPVNTKTVRVFESVWDDVCADEFQEIQPVFNRPGCWEYYCRRYGLVWIEVDGKAYLYKNGGVAQTIELALQNDMIPSLRECEMEAIRVLMSNRLASKWQIETYNENKRRELTRRISRDIRRTFIQGDAPNG